MKPFLFALLMLLPTNLIAQDFERINVAEVNNLIQIGDLAGNRNLEFGVRNVLEEYLLEADFDLFPDAEKQLYVDIVFLDVLTTSRNISVFSKRSEAVVIRLRGVLKENDKKVKEVVAEESSAEISMTTLVIDQGGNFNQTSLSNALKKACEKLVKELTE